ncbi:MAG: 50S ribosomal protein L10 [Deltaproteobacteria bacterium]|nr:50S ribosomal protein L10 [Deltaproteobacteria bacterium]
MKFWGRSSKSSGTFTSRGWNEKAREKGDGNLKKEDKSIVVADLHQRMLRPKVAILTRFIGLNGGKMTHLRAELRRAAVEYRIVKNTLLRLAIQGTDKELLGTKLEGPIAVAWSDTDPIAPARVLAKFAKDFPELKILVASSEGKLWSPEEIQAWVTLPSLKELRAKILGFIQGPASNLARLMSTPGTRLAQLLKAKSQKEE